MTELIKIAFGMDSRGNLYSGHFGDSNYYQIAEITQEGKIILKEKIPNPHRDEADKEEAHHGEKGKAMSISSLLPGVHIVAAHAMGLNAAKMKKKYHILLFTELRFSEIEKIIQTNIQKIWQFANQHQKKITRLN